MRAVICREYGQPEKLVIGDHPAPVAGAGQVLIDVAHAGVSFVDTLMIQNRHQNKHELPFVPGMEVAGTVRSVGSGVSRLKEGDRVAALCYDGGFGEVAVADASETFSLPDGIDTSLAAAILSVYLTSYLALTDVGELKSGETLLVTGAAGGVGLAAVEIGHALGGRVIAAASQQAKVEVAISRGAAAGVVYGQGNSPEPFDLRGALREAAPKGIDVALDPVAGPLFQGAFRSLNWGGRYLSVGFAGGEIPQIPANHLLVKHRSARGFVLMYYRKFQHQVLQQAAADLFQWILEGRISPHVPEVADLADAPRIMLDILERRAVGKTSLALQKG